LNRRKNGKVKRGKREEKEKKKGKCKKRKKEGKEIRWKRKINDWE
jgi:hypothetical protein